MCVREIELERRIADDKVKLLERDIIVLLVIRRHQRIALHSIVKTCNKVVQDEVQFKHLIASLTYVLAVNCAAVFADLMGQGHEQRASSRRWVVALNAMQVGAVAHKQTSHHTGNGLGCVILGILAAACVIVVLDQVLENVAEKVIFFIEHRFKRELGEFVDQCPGKLTTFGRVGHEISQFLEYRDFGLFDCVRIENVDVEFRNIKHRLVED